MKIYIKRFILVLLFSIILITISGCKKTGYYGKLEEQECGIFKYAIRELKDGRKEGYLLGLIEDSKYLEEIIIPQELNGVQIVGFGYEWGTGFYMIKEFANFKNVNKMYFNFEVKENTFDQDIYYDIYF